MCMPALGGRIKVEIVEIRNSLEHICMLFQHQPKTSPKVKFATKNDNDIETRYVQIWFDTS